MNFRYLLLKIISLIMMTISIFFKSSKKNILIFRCGGLGDFLLETVTIHRLRKAFPQDQYKIFYVHRQLNSETIATIIPVDQVIIFNEKSFFHIILSAISIWRHRYSLLINMSDPRYPLMHRIIGMCCATKKFAYDYPSHRFIDNEFEKFRKEYDVFVNFSWQKDHVMTMTINLLKELTGCSFPEPSYADYIKIHASLPAKKLHISQPYIVFSLFGSADNRNLPNEKILSLLTFCKYKFPSCKLILAGSGKDYSQAETLIKSLPELNDVLINLCCKTSYFELYSLAANADFMIGIDSGITHFGALFSPHTFVLVRKHLPELFFPYPEKFMDKITIISAELCPLNHQCLQCLKTYTPTPCMQNLSIEKITQAINEVVCVSNKL